MKNVGTLLPAHVTLCREDELANVDRSVLAHRLREIHKESLILVFGKPELVNGHGIFLQCIAGEQAFVELREHILGTRFIRRQFPLITLAHPRNPKAPGSSLSNAQVLPERIAVVFNEIQLIEQTDANPWQLLDNYSFPNSEPNGNFFKRENIRPLAICVFLNSGRILVNEDYDDVKNQRFCRPLGGGIEFGETSAEAVMREILEELSAEVSELRFLGSLENIFTYEGKPGHEIVQVYDGKFVEKTLYGQASISGVESNGREFKAVWRELDSFSDEIPLYPDGLLGLLNS